MRNLYHDKVGSNQYVRKPKVRYLKPKTHAWIWIIILAIAIPEVAFFTQARLEKIYQKTNQYFAVTAYASEKTVEPLTSEQEKIVNYIHEIFGRYAPEAIKIAKCESGLNPKAIGTNVDFSQDFGLFQLNSHYHGFNKGVNNSRHLLDYKINTLMAWNIFKGSDYQWNLWMCADKVGL